jgi:microcystin-dependent protein
MVESNSPRFGVRRWSEQSDTTSRAEFDNSFAAIESLGAIYGQGTLGLRPAAGKVGRFYYVTGDGTSANNGVLWYDNGTAWSVVGANMANQRIQNVATPVSNSDAATKQYADQYAPLTGEIKIWPTSVAPAGWLLCNGQAVSRTTYAALFAVIGTTWGVGDNSTTFNLPDVRDKFLVGAGTLHPFSQSGGLRTITLSSSQLPAHTHSINHDHPSVTTGSAGVHTHTLYSRGGFSQNDLGSYPRIKRSGENASPAYQSSDMMDDSQGSHTHSVNLPSYTGTSGSTGSGSGITIDPPWVGLTLIMKT